MDGSAPSLHPAGVSVLAHLERASAALDAGCAGASLDPLLEAWRAVAHVGGGSDGAGHTRSMRKRTAPWLSLHGLSVK